MISSAMVFLSGVHAEYDERDVIVTQTFLGGCDEVTDKPVERFFLGAEPADLAGESRLVLRAGRSLDAVHDTIAAEYDEVADFELDGDELRPQGRRHVLAFSRREIASTDRLGQCRIPAGRLKPEL
jgi:hypothetical protein